MKAKIITGFLFVTIVGLWLWAIELTILPEYERHTNVQLLLSYGVRCFFPLGLIAPILFAAMSKNKDAKDGWFTLVWYILLECIVMLAIAFIHEVFIQAWVLMVIDASIVLGVFVYDRHNEAS